MRPSTWTVGKIWILPRLLADIPQQVLLCRHIPITVMVDCKRTTIQPVSLQHQPFHAFHNSSKENSLLCTGSKRPTSNKPQDVQKL